MIAMCVSFMPGAYAAYSDVPEESEIYNSVSLLDDLNIVSGYTDGSYKPEKTLTRAEFAKLIVMAYGKESEAKSNSITSGFKDVEQGAWYVGYVNYISQKEIINGYADGNFGPERPITYAEAVTIICRLLGYNEEMVGYYWPDNYLNQAKALGLEEGMNFGAKDPITRGAAAVMIDRVLFTDVPESIAPDTKLIETLGYTLLEDSYIMATRNENSSLTSKQVKTASGIYEAAEGVEIPKVGITGTVILNKDGKLSGVKKEKMEYITAYVTKIPQQGTIEYKTNSGISGSYKFDSSFTLYHDYSKLTYSQAAAFIDIDTELTFYGKNQGEWEFAIINSDQTGNIPVLAARDYTGEESYIGDTPINKNNLQVYKNGDTATLSDIKKNDVLYYNTNTNVIDVYSKKVSGIYSEAYPSKAHVSQVLVSGKTYELSGAGGAKSMLDASSGSFAIGEKVTLLLGKDDKVEFAVELTDFNYSDYGVLLSCEKGVSQEGYDEGSSRITAELFMPDGKTYTYVVDKDYEERLKGKLVKLIYDGSVVSLKEISQSELSGSLNISARKFAGKTVLKDVKIIHRLSDEEADNVSLEILKFDTLGVNELNSTQVINIVEANGFGDIGIMYLENMSTSYQTGYLLSKVSESMGDDVSYTYKIFSDGIKTEYTRSANYSTKAGQPVYFKTENGSVTSIYNMQRIASAADYDAIDGGRIRIGDNVYSIAGDVEIILKDKKAPSGVRTISLSELKDTDIDGIAIYAMQDEGEDSLIKMIVVS